jgi:hypothetical protein
MYRFFLLCGVWLCLVAGYAQSVCPSTPDFMDLQGSCVTCNYGTTSNPFQNTGIVNGRHTLITQQGSDPKTGGQLPLLPPGENSVIRLGNECIGAEAEAITYRFIVEADAAILLLKFAVVLEDPDHFTIYQPRFVVRVLDGSGNLVEDCAEYDVSAGAGIPGFQTYYGPYGGCVRWRPWTNVGIDLSHFIGQEVRVQFVTYDCHLTAHFGYAYFTASCIPNRLDLLACNGQTVTLAAPPDFESYHWSNGSTQRTTQFTVTGQSLDAYCDITSATGCQFTLCAHISNESGLPTHDMTVYDTICEGEGYNDHYFNLPVQNELGTYTYVTTLFKLSDCSGDIDITLFLTVLQHYYSYYDDVCRGEDYAGHGFYISAEQLQDSLNAHPTQSTFVFSDFVPVGVCQQYVSLYLTVNPTFAMPNLIDIDGDLSPCTEVPTEYRVLNGDGLSHYNWVIPPGVTLVSGQGTSCMTVVFDDTAPQTITLQGENGCGSGAIPLVVTPKQSYHIFFNDSLCSGNPYDANGFHLPMQDSLGWFTFINNYTTAAGCDSIRVLQLLVTSTPTLITLAEPAVICDGGSTTIHALGDNASIIQGGSSTPPEVAIGDIVCTDGSIVKPANWPCGRTAKGIVFYVDDTGLHGWMVHLQNQAAGGIKWSTEERDIPSLTNYTAAHIAITDFDGYGNTQKIRNFGNALKYPAAWVVDFANGWYLPAMGQLNILYGNLVEVNAGLAAVGGTLFEMNSSWWCWSSSEYSSNYAWYQSSNGGVNGFITKGYTNTDIRVRSVSAF